MLPSKPGWLAIHQAAWYGQDTCLRILLSGRYIYRQKQKHYIKGHGREVPCLCFCAQLSRG